MPYELLLIEKSKFSIIIAFVFNPNLDLDLAPNGAFFFTHVQR